MLFRSKKEEYTFYHPTTGKDPIITWTEFKKLHAAGAVSQEDFLSRQAKFHTWLDSHETSERAWARAAIASTDYMMLPDATYKGEPLAGTSKYADITAYRKQVREYDLRESPRPETPSWYKSEVSAPTPLAIGG